MRSEDSFFSQKNCPSQAGVVLDVEWPTLLFEFEPH